ncbi:unnamed protein product [Choristocarpus tenellus]
MIKGWLSKRTQALGGGMDRRFCVLAGPLMLDFEHEEDFLNGLPPKAESEVIGVANWNGKGRSHTYENGMVYVTRLGSTNYCSAPSATERTTWMSGMRTALEMTLEEGSSTEEFPLGVCVGPGKGIAHPLPRRGSLQRGVLQAPEPAESEVCMWSGQSFGMTQSRHHCQSCGRVGLSEYCNREIPLTHHGFEQAVRVCDACLRAQQLLTHLRFVTCLLEGHLHLHRLACQGERVAVMAVPTTAVCEG